VNAAFAKTIEFVAGYTARKVQPDKEFGLLFVGPPGVGKTHLAVAALSRLVNEHGAQGLFADFREIIKTIQASYNSISGTSEMELLRPLLQTEVLLLDDLGVSRMTEWVRDMVGHIISTRYNEGRVTLITTNLDDDGSEASGIRVSQGGSHRDDLARKVAARPSLADRVGSEVRSRLHEMCEPVLMKGDDYRLGVGRHGRRGKD
jgi:DNA replication protein DnaC